MEEPASKRPRGADARDAAVAGPVTADLTFANTTLPSDAAEDAVATANIHGVEEEKEREVINWRDALEQCSEDEDFLRELLGDLKEEVQENNNIIQTAIVSKGEVRGDSSCPTSA